MLVITWRNLLLRLTTLMLLFGLAAPVSISAAGEFPQADLVVVEKGLRKLHLFKSGEAFRTFDIALGIRPTGDKNKKATFERQRGATCSTCAIHTANFFCRFTYLIRISKIANKPDQKA